MAHLSLAKLDDVNTSFAKGKTLDLRHPVHAQP